MRRAALGLASLVFGLSACTDEPSPVEPIPVVPDQAIIDAGEVDGLFKANPNFHWLPPIEPLLGFVPPEGEPNTDLSPVVTVCNLIEPDGGDPYCGDVVVTFTRDAMELEQNVFQGIRESFVAFLPVREYRREFTEDKARIIVSVNGVFMGLADIEFEGRGNFFGLRLRGGDFVPLNERNGFLAIRFLFTQGATPCDDEDGECSFQQWNADDDEHFVLQSSSEAGPSQLFLDADVTALVDGEPVSSLVFELSQKLGTTGDGCFDSVDIGDPAFLTLNAGGNPDICWQVLAYLPDDLDTPVEVVFEAGSTGLPVLSFCPQSAVVQSVVADPSSFTGASIHEDSPAQTLTILGDRPMPFEAIGEDGFTYTAAECAEEQADELGFLRDAPVLGRFASLAGRGLRLFMPQRLWAFTAGFHLSLPGTRTIYFPTSTPEEITVEPEEPAAIGLDETLLLTAVALHQTHDEDGDVEAPVEFGVAWTSLDEAIATVSPVLETAQATVAPDPDVILTQVVTILAQVTPAPGAVGIADVVDADGNPITASVQVTVEGATPCGEESTACVAEEWTPGDADDFIIETSSPESGPAQVFIDSNVTATVEGVGDVDNVIFKFEQKTGTFGCFDNVRINDPELDPENLFEPAVCWELLAFADDDTGFSDPLSLVFGPGPNEELPVLSFCPEPYVVDKALEDAELFSAGFVHRDEEGETLGLLDETTLPQEAGDFHFTAQECAALETEAALQGRGLLGELALVARRAARWFGPQSAWAFTGGFHMALPGTKTIYFPTSTPKLIAISPEAPLSIASGETLALSAQAFHHHVDDGEGGEHDEHVEALEFEVAWSSSNVAVASVAGFDGESLPPDVGDVTGGDMTGTAEITATVVPNAAPANVLAVELLRLNDGVLVSAPVTASVSVTVFADGLVSHWPGDGTANDVAFGNHGTLENGASFATGVLEQGFSLDGVDDWIDAPGTHIDDLQDLTVSTWVRLDTPPGQEFNRFVTLSGEKAVLRHDGHNNTIGKLHFYMSIDGLLRHIFVEDALQGGCFRHVAGTYDGSTMRLYLDGAEVGMLPIVGIVDPGEGVELSSDFEPIHGVLDDVRVYNRALSAAEIEALWNEGGVDCPPEASAGSLGATILDFNSAGISNGTVALYGCDAVGTTPGLPGICANPVLLETQSTDASGMVSFGEIDPTGTYRVEPITGAANVSPRAWTVASGQAGSDPTTTFYLSTLDQEQATIDFDIDLPFSLQAGSANAYAQLFTAGISGELIELQLPVTCDAAARLVVQIMPVTVDPVTLATVPDQNLILGAALVGHGQLPGSAAWSVVFGTVQQGGSVFPLAGAPGAIGPPLTEGTQYAIYLRNAGSGTCSIPPGPPTALGGLAGQSATGPWFPDDAMPFRTFVRGANAGDPIVIDPIICTVSCPGGGLNPGTLLTSGE